MPWRGIFGKELWCHPWNSKCKISDFERRARPYFTDLHKLMLTCSNACPRVWHLRCDDLSATASDLDHTLVLLKSLKSSQWKCQNNELAVIIVACGQHSGWENCWWTPQLQQPWPLRLQQVVLLASTLKFGNHSIQMNILQFSNPSTYILLSCIFIFSLIQYSLY